MSNPTVGTALAKVDSSPRGLVQQYKADFAMVLPSHMNPDAFIRVALGVLRRNDKLEQAARRDTGAFLAAMLDAARLGLEPGTAQYWLIPRYNKKAGGEIVSGQVGYQGEIELIYRAGATATVVCEVVRDGDVFVWTPGALDAYTPPRWNGAQERPLHIIDWADEGRENRPLKLVYAYGLMKGGGTSKVVVLTRSQVMKAKAVNKDSDGEYSPWRKWEEAMWLKTALHRLSKFVPTSSEYIGVKPGPQLGGSPVTIALPAGHPSAPMPSSDDMWAGGAEEPVVGHDHEDDDYHADCEGCRAESAAMERQAARE